MKFVDILARELKVWPEGFSEKVGQCINGRLHGYSGNGYPNCQVTNRPFTLCSDFQNDTVTRAEWQAAVDAMNAPNVDGPNIDWSAQPKDFPLWLEGTTEEHRKNSGWYRVSNQVFLGKEGGQWRSFREGQFFTVHRKPGTKVVEWDGVGLPPIGTVCEHSGTADHTNWIEVQVIGHGNVRFHDVAFFEYMDGTREYTVSYSTENNFRAVRTAEQVAAEEREKAINEMVFGDCGCEPDGRNTATFMVCGFLYDAGYRKQVAK